MFARYLLFFLFIIPVCLHAQNNFVFQHLTVEDGLLANPKLNVYQDSEGFYWIASVSGLQRYDGKNFVSYKYDYGNKSITGDWTGQPLEDREKNIWIINESGINIFQRESQRLVRLYLPDAKDSSENNVVTIAKDNKNCIWILTNKTVFIYDEQLHKVKFVSNIIKGDSGLSSAFYDKERNGFWMYIFSSASAIAFFNCATKEISFPLKNISSQDRNMRNQVSLFSMDNSGNLWLASYLGDLCKYDPDKNLLTSYNIFKNRDKEKILFPWCRLSAWNHSDFLQTKRGMH